MSDSNLTQEKILEMMRSLPKREPDLFNPFRLRPFGMELFEAPPPPPRVQVRDVKLKDGTSVFPPEALAAMNSWLIGRFGFKEDLFSGDNVYLLGSYGIFGSRANIGILRNLGP